MRPPGAPPVELDYWQKPCVCCRMEDRNRTNLECVTEIAELTGTPLEDAKRMFRKPDVQHPEPTDWQIFKTEYLREVE